MKNNRIEELILLTETKFLNLYKAKFRSKSGKIGYWTIASRKNYKKLHEFLFNNNNQGPDAVVIVALHEPTGKLVIIKQFRIPLNDYVYELPAGLVDDNEDIVDTMKRELKEETGLEVTKIIENMGSKNAYGSTGMTEESIALMYCKCTGEVSSDYMEDDEEIETLLISKEEAYELLQSNEKMDVKLIMILQSYVKLGDKFMD